MSATPLEKAVVRAQDALTNDHRFDYDADSWDIFVGNQMQSILDAAEARRPALDVTEAAWDQLADEIVDLVSDGDVIGVRTTITRHRAAIEAEARADALDAWALVRECRALLLDGPLPDRIVLCDRLDAILAARKP